MNHAPVDSATAKRGTVRELRRRVVSRGLCTGCGTCVAVCPVRCLAIPDVEPVYSGGCTSCGACVAACPGEDIPMSDLEAGLFGSSRGEEQELGLYRGLRAGYARDEAVRDTGTSGGVVSALLTHLLETGRITGAVVSAMDAERPWRARPTIARTAEEIRRAAGSKYIMCPQNAVLTGARPDDRLALVGLPCQIHGLRKGAGLDSPTARVELAVGLFCLSNFLPEATAYLIEEVFGISVEEVSSVAYRDGAFPGEFAVVDRAGSRQSLAYGEAKQHLRMFRPYRCTVCFDWSAELADLAVGDLWSDPSREAYSTIVVRTGAGEAALDSAEAGGVLALEPVEYRHVIDNPGFRYKKRGNLVAIGEARRHGLPTPTYPRLEATDRPMVSTERRG